MVDTFAYFNALIDTRKQQAGNNEKKETKLNSNDNKPIYFLDYKYKDCNTH